MVEQVPIADDKYQPLEMILHHQPLRKSYGLHNILLRKQAYHWRAVIAGRARFYELTMPGNGSLLEPDIERWSSFTEWKDKSTEFFEVGTRPMDDYYRRVNWICCGWMFRVEN
jgi:hypothetical protein